MTTLSSVKKINLKSVSIFFIVLFNVGSMFPQKIENINRKHGSLQPVVLHYQCNGTLLNGGQKVVYTVYQAQRFPKIECPSVQELSNIDDSENFDLTSTLTCKPEKQKNETDNIVSVEFTNTNKKS